METQRKYLLMTRHGVAPQIPGHGSADAIKPESIVNLYNSVGQQLHNSLQEAGIFPARSFINHSDKVRTKYTAQAIASGAFGLKPAPSCQEDLARIESLSLIDTQAVPALGFSDIQTSNKLIAKGTRAYVDFWVANPNAREYEGEAMMSFSEMSKRGKDYLANVLLSLMNNDKRFGIIATHAGNVESMAMPLINSARSKPIASLDEIGGAFDMEQNALLSLDYNPASGMYSKVTLSRNGQVFPVDLRNL